MQEMMVQNSPLFQYVEGDNDYTGDEMSVPFDFSLYGYSTITGANHSSYRTVSGIGQVDIVDYTSYDTSPSGMNSDGTWIGWTPEWMWMVAWHSFTDPAHGVAQWQTKAKITGPAKGTLVVYASVLNTALSIPDSDPISSAYAVSSLTYYNLSIGQVLELYPALPATPSSDSPGSANLVAFRWGKQPSDFGFGYITSMAPNSVMASGDAALVITGIGLTSGFTLSIGGVDVTAESSLISGTEIDVAWTGFTLPNGVYDVTYTPTTGPASVLVGGFTVAPISSGPSAIDADPNPIDSDPKSIDQ